MITGSHFRQRHQRGLVNTRDTHGSMGFDPTVGGLPMGVARDGEQSNTPDIAPGAIDGEVHIQPGTITRPLFAETIIPPEVLDALPALPDADYPQGVLVFLTTDEKLYRNTDGSTWSVAVDGEDIVANSITAGQIAAGAIGTTELAADAVIANVVNVGGTVTIDDDGIVITDGAIELSDASGGSVLTSAGFAGAWLSFLSSGFYNGDFAFGTLNDITAATIVGTASTPADYLASLSPDIPYWIVRSESGAGTLQRVVDSDAASGFALRWDGTEDAEVAQDVPISPGQNYAAWFAWKHTSDADFFFEFSTHFRDANHAAIGSEFSQSTSGWSSSMTEYEIDKAVDLSGFAPMNARYMRVSFRFARISGSPTIHLSQVFLERGTSYAQMQHYGFGLEIRYPQGSGYTTPTFELTNSGTLFWNDPTGVITGAGLFLRTDSQMTFIGTSSVAPQLGFRKVGGAWDYLLLDAPNSQIKIGGGAAAPDVVLERLTTAILRATETRIRATQAASSGIAFDAHVTGDSVQRWRVNADGLMQWGSGAGAVDTNLYRSAANSLQTDDSFIVGAALLTPGETVSTLNADANDYNPGGNPASIRFISFTAARTLTGLVFGSVGRFMILVNNTGQSLILAHDNASSTTTNRFRCPGAASVTVRGGGSVLLLYSNSRWSVVAI